MSWRPDPLKKHCRTLVPRDTQTTTVLCVWDWGGNALDTVGLQGKRPLPQAGEARWIEAFLRGNS